MKKKYQLKHYRARSWTVMEEEDQNEQYPHRFYRCEEVDPLLATLEPKIHPYMKTAVELTAVTHSHKGVPLYGHEAFRQGWALKANPWRTGGAEVEAMFWDAAWMRENAEAYHDFVYGGIPS